LAEVLRAFDVGRLQESDCYFGGGTAISMLLGEYRESVDIDFMCASGEGYRRLRNTVTPTDLGPLLKTPLKYLRDEVRTNEYKVFTILEMNEIPVKVGFVFEARIPLAGALNAALGVPVLVRDDLYAEKLLANADRGLDRAVLSRDVIDHLAMMMQGWGDIPETAWRKVLQSYGKFSRPKRRGVG
ncbi:MAG: nucleotidyl transferase AbiEii/AbiGii toxin family protein, partial [Burkholderiales bacterium]